jgi:KDO2-lipid IV(A) lauroyltransferase
MEKLLSYLVYYILVIPVSRLPFGLLYLFSDFLYFLVYFGIGYRKYVVRTNLRNSFPHYPLKEIIAIEKKFYRHFTDFLVESAKSLSISAKDIEERCALINPEIVNQYYESGRGVVVLCGHYNNWEYYAVGIAQQMKHQTASIYRPLKNDFFDNIIKASRQRFGMKMITMRNAPRFFASLSESEPTMTIMVNDQSPGNPKTAHWNNFLNQETGWMFGAEKLARKYDQVVFFGCIRKRKRGFYEVTFYPITDDIQNEKEGYVTDQHAMQLEKVINEDPSYWLWSHKRWKHKKVKND